MIRRNVLYMISLARKASKLAAVLQVLEPGRAHSLVSAASLAAAAAAAAGRHSPLHHPASQAMQVVSHHRTL